jgi:hypothetical protein
MAIDQSCSVKGREFLDELSYFQTPFCGVVSATETTNHRNNQLRPLPSRSCCALDGIAGIHLRQVTSKQNSDETNEREQLQSVSRTEETFGIQRVICK